MATNLSNVTNTDLDNISLGINQSLYIDSGSIDYIKKFNRFRYRHPDIEMVTGIGYVFFTKPDLNIFTTSDATELNKKLTTNAHFYDLFTFDKEILKQLQDCSGQDNFIKILTNYSENFDLTDDIGKTSDGAETCLKWKMVYGGNTVESKAANSFSINYTDDRNLSVYKLHKGWVDYIDLVSRGQIDPNEDDKHYITKRIIDYMCSAYYFLLAEDGETIKFYSKYTGVFPTNIPNSALSWNKGDFKSIKFPISYQYIIKEDMNPLSLNDFNDIVKGNKVDTYMETYNAENYTMGKPWVDYPFVYIQKDKSGKPLCYKLGFAEK